MLKLDNVNTLKLKVGYSVGSLAYKGYHKYGVRFGYWEWYWCNQITSKEFYIR